jgi:hypothetical protein
MVPHSQPPAPCPRRPQWLPWNSSPQSNPVGTLALMPQNSKLRVGHTSTGRSNRLKQLIVRLPAGVDEMAFLPAILSAALPKT